ncbi:endonuclease [Psychroserpens sp.]
MKHSYILLITLITITASAQVPAGYYNSATGSGYTLKTELKRIIDNVNDGLSPEYISINLSYSALYNTYELSDVDVYFENNGTLLDIYSEKPTDTDSYEYTYGSSQQDDGTLGTAEGQRFNREHIIPQAVFDGDTPMRNDAHFVVPTDKYVNAQRDNFPFGVVDNATLTTSNGSKKGNNLNSGYSAGYTNTVFEPIDEFKGDIARMYFYFVTRYEDSMTSFEPYDMFDGSSDKCFDDTFLNILYTWHTNDPVSQREIDRNNNIDGIGSSTRQRNRNPYIDHPEFVFDIWQNALSVEEFETVDAFTIYPNPVNTILHIELQSAKLTHVEIYNVLGKLVISKTINNSETIQTERLSNGMYILRLTQGNNTISKKLIKN